MFCGKPSSPTPLTTWRITSWDGLTTASGWDKKPSFTPIIAKQYFAENHDDELLGKTIRFLQPYYQKYDLKPENFAKVEGRSINRARRFYLRSLNNRIRSVKAFDRPASDSFLTWPLNSFSFLKPSSILISSVSKFSGVRTRVPGANCN